MSDPRPNVADPGRVIAHRGASMIAPENTLGALRAAAAQGAFWAELDVSLLGDGTPVIHHDATLDRCTSGSGPLSEIAHNDLAGLTAGGTEPLPHLEQMLDLVEALGFFVNLEMKPHNAPERIADKVAAALLARPWSRHRVIVSSFNLQALAALRRKSADAALAVLFDDPPADWPAALESVNAAALHMNHLNLTQSLLSKAQAHGVEVRVYTVNRPILMEPFRDLGLTGIVTDHPPFFLDDPDWAHWAEG